MNGNRFALLLAALCFFALFWRLGAIGLTEPDEGRTAGKAYEFLDGGHWLEPRLYGLGHFNKPPLVYWAGAVCQQMGGINEWMARLPAALSALLTLLLTYRIVVRLLGRDVAGVSVLVLLTAPLFFVMGRLIDPNMMLTAWVTLAFWSVIAWQQDGRRWQLGLFHAALALGFLTKGPVALAIVVLTLAGYRFWPAARRTVLPWRSPWSLAGALGCAAASLAWFLIVARRHPELYDLFLGRELVDRVASDAHGRGEPVFFYLAIFPLGLLPWLPSLVVGLRDAWKRRDDADRLALAGIVLPVLLFTLSKSKLPTYILPLFPFAALMSARGFLAHGNCLRFRWAQWLSMATFSVAIVAGLAFHGTSHYGWPDGLRVWDALWLLPAAGGVWWAIRRPAAGFACMLVSAYLATHGLVARHDDRLDNKTSPRQMAAALKPILRDGDRVILFRNYPRGLNFYLQRPITVSDKFELHVNADRERLGDLLYDDDAEVGRVYAWFDREPRVFIVTSDRKRGGEAGKERSPLDFLKAGVRKPVRELYRDGKYVVVCNFP